MSFGSAIFLFGFLPVTVVLYRLLPGLCLPLLEPGGALLLEIGEDQGEAVRALLLEAGYRNVEVLRDFAGLDRVVLGFS